MTQEPYYHFNTIRRLRNTLLIHYLAGSFEQAIADEYKTIDTLNEMVEDGIESGSGRSVAVYSSSDEETKASKPSFDEVIGKFVNILELTSCQSKKGTRTPFGRHGI